VLPLAARIGETKVDVFDVVVLDRFQDIFGGLHENPSWLLVMVIRPRAEPRRQCSIPSGGVQDNKPRRRNRHLHALSAGSMRILGVIRSSVRGCAAMRCR
jgi:hypothetical protein